MLSPVSEDGEEKRKCATFENSITSVPRTLGTISDGLCHPTPEQSQPYKDKLLNLGEEISEHFGIIKVEGWFHVFVLSAEETTELSSLLKPRFPVWSQCDGAREVSFS